MKTYINKVQTKSQRACEFTNSQRDTKKLRMTFYEWKAWLQTEDAVKYYQKLKKEGNL